MFRLTAVHSTIRHSCRMIGCITFALILANCSGSDSGNTPELESEASKNAWPSHDIVFADCMVIAARAAYTPLADLGDTLCEDLYADSFEHMPKFATDVLRVFKRRVTDMDKTYVDVLVTFAGTRAPDLGDILRDLQSQITTDYVNHFDADRPDALALTGDEKTGAGFDARWKNHAENVKKALTAIDDESKTLEQDPAITISVIGHSLGAAAATRAAFDLNRSLIQKRIILWSFNSPRIGNSEFATAYVDSLKTCKNTDAGCFMIRQFTRAGDPIHELPLLLNHPVWNISQDQSNRTQTGKPTERTLDYCAHYHAPRASTLNLPQNHKLDRWRMDLNEIPPGHVECMFSKP